MQYHKQAHFDAPKTPTDAVGLEMILSDLYSQIVQASRLGQVDMCRQLMLYARVIARVQKVIIDKFDGDITGVERDMFALSEDDRISMKFDEKTLSFKVVYDDTMLREMMGHMADEVFDDPKAKAVIHKSLAKLSENDAKKKDMKAIEDFLDSLKKDPPTP